MTINTLKPLTTTSFEIRDFQQKIVETMQHDSVHGEQVTRDEISDVFANVEQSLDLSYQEKAGLAQEAFKMTSSRQNSGAGEFLQNFISNQLLQNSIESGVHSLSEDEQMVQANFANWNLMAKQLSDTSTKILNKGGDTAQTKFSASDYLELQSFLRAFNGNMGSLKGMIDAQYQMAASTDTSSIHDNTDDIIAIYEASEKTTQLSNSILGAINDGIKNNYPLDKVKISDLLDRMLLSMEQSKSHIMNVLDD